MNLTKYNYKQGIFNKPTDFLSLNINFTEKY